MDRTSGRWVISRTLSATMHPSSAPPAVDMWANPSCLSHCPERSLTTQHEMGYMPPVIPLPITMMSGSTPYLVIAHIAPVRIRPVWTSSAM